MAGAVAMFHERTGSESRVSARARLFDASSVGAVSKVWSPFDVLQDGGFLMAERAAWEKEPPVIHVILNWAEGLRAKGTGK